MDPTKVEKAKRRLQRLAQAAVSIEPGVELGPNHGERSFFGGLPRLPPGIAWPEVRRRSEDGDGEGAIAPTFLCQVDLSALPPVPQRRLLPTRGTLYFFCNTQFVDVGDPECRVIFHPEPCDPFQDSPPPCNLMRLGGTIEPIMNEYADDDVRSRVERCRSMVFRHHRSYPNTHLVDGLDETQAAFDQLWPFNYEYGVPRQMLGYAYLVQDVDHYYEGAVLLLQLAGGFGWNNYGCGCALQIWIKQEHLAHREFENAVATLNCS